MRLLGCFSKPAIVLDPSEPISSAPTTPPPPAPTEPAFVPASIPELHPEYAHAEPYCFAARTDSARHLVDRARCARGQPPLDRATVLREQGLVVVRGPAHTATPPKKGKEADGAPRRSVPLQVETPTTVHDGFVESDDPGGDENVDSVNVQGRRSRAFERKASRSLKKKDAKPRGSKRSTKGKSSRKSPATPPPRPDSGLHQRLSDAGSLRSARSARSSEASLPIAPASPATAALRRTYSSSDADDTDSSELQHALSRTPPALLAPIVVPRMSAVLSDTDRVSPAPSPLPPASPSVSNDSWVPSDSAARYDDVEDESSSGFISLTAPIGKQSVVHKAAPRAHVRDSPLRDSPLHDSPQHDLPSVEAEDALAHAERDTALSSASVRSKRKSKPFLPSLASLESNDGPGLAPDSVYSAPVEADPLVNDRLAGGLGALPKATLSRQISSGVSSDDIQVVDTITDDLFHIPSPAAKVSAKQRVQHDDLPLLPRAAGPQGIMRRASTANKRKTVSFHEESPVIIEPNLRAPSRSLPRDAMLAKSTSNSSEYKDALDTPATSFAGLRNVRDSMSLASSATPTLDLPRRTNRELSDSSGASDNFTARSSRRMSRVSIKDKAAIREASKRQSQAVAKAMSEQIRGVPRSAMLAYTENEVLLSDDPLEEEDGSDRELSFRRRSRPSKSIRMPPRVVPGEVPPPPPPPPFAPEPRRVKSVRKPPPPPSSPLSY